MEWVDTVIKQHKCDINLFSVVFNLKATSKSSFSCINNWIRFAMKKRVQALHLCLSTTPRVPKIEASYVLHQKLFSPKCFVGFKSLKVLHLINVNVCGEVIEYVLSKCFSLEELLVHGSLTLVNLRVVRPSLALKYLVIAYCFKIRSIEICDAENLVSFYCCCYEEDRDLRLLIRNVPMLLRLFIYSSHIGYRYVCEKQVFVLSLHAKTYIADIFFLVQLFSYKENEELDLVLLKPTKCPHNYLKKLSILNYLGRTSDIEIIFNLIENVVSLEQISVDTDGKEKGGGHAMQHLKVKIPSRIDLNTFNKSYFICFEN
ncbi:hypothetical protein FEM48_Zijuj02G0086500 [Ziziphus jujuba var. spinosa]|uniref:At1g61320/AtMIF1 LRR domain-containing protein n=1 Tax=Ziziphus jujuba var. spinosa TaxID=714518 RepID=A0A978VUR0_ZIZJJ|nr:hypothetical protein FEM48_Zijuj02G0086500 [Ziziphus jujuba var. spinosa]